MSSGEGALDGFFPALVTHPPPLHICSPTTKVLRGLSKTMNFIIELNILMSNTTSFRKHFQPISSSLPLSPLEINWLISLVRHFARKLLNACALILGGSLNTPIERGSNARLGGVHFSGPPRFGPFGIFWSFFAKFGFSGPKLF